MKRVLFVLVATLVVGGLAATAFARSGTPPAPPATAQIVLGQCPKTPLRLPSEAVARAADQARIEAPFIYKGLGRSVVLRSQRAPSAGVRGAEVKNECGKTVFRRTVVVDLFFPKMLPSASLSQGTVFVSLVPTGYRVWERAH